MTQFQPEIKDGYFTFFVNIKIREKSPVHKRPFTLVTLRKWEDRENIFDKEKKYVFKNALPRIEISSSPVSGFEPIEVIIFFQNGSCDSCLIKYFKNINFALWQNV
jgi:hypothetical protein